MTKKLNLLIVFIALIIGASSCNYLNRITIVKRHYSKGNYVSISKKPKPYVYHSPNKKQDTPKVSSLGEKTETAISSTENPVVVADNKQRKISQLQAPEKRKSTIGKSNQFTQEQIKPRIKQADVFRKSNSLFQHKLLHEDGFIGSLLWLIIVVLLVLWLLALATGGWGVGGLIHILAVIALVLLIIWLIRNL